MATFPDNSKNIVALSNSLLKYFNVTPMHETLPELDKVLSEQKPKNVIFLILDGLGENVLPCHLPEDSFLRSNRHCTISSVFPPTTTAATTSYHSGLYPIEHGWLGWMPYYKEYDRVIETYTNNDFYTGKPVDCPPVKDLIAYKTIYEYITEQNPDVEYHHIFPAFEPNGAKTFPEMCERISKAVKGSQKSKIISAYWPNPDSNIHHFGVNSKEAHSCLQEIDAELQKLVSDLQDAVIVISADHGIIDVEEVMLNDYPQIASCLRLPPSLEARFVSFFIKDGCHVTFEQEFKKQFSGDFILLSKQEFLDSGLLGKGKPHYKVDDFIGDFVAIGTGIKEIRYEPEGIDYHESLVADHAGLSPDELSVPLIIWKSA